MKSNENNFGYRGDRVRAHTSSKINRQIDRQMRGRVQIYAAAGAEEIELRIRELEQEWDIERVLETNASTLMVVGTALGFAVNRRWLGLPFAVASFLLMHAVSGWCPPLPFLRRLGFRTQREIEAEKYALKALQKMETSQTEGKPAQLSVGI